MSKYMLYDCVTGDKPVENRTILKLGWADNALYLTIRCYDNDMENLNVTTDRDDHPPMWWGDSVDILIETHQHAYYQIVVNPAGARLDLDRGVRKKEWFKWSSQADIAAHVGDG